MVTENIKQKKRLKTFLILGGIFVIISTIWLLLVIIQVPYEDVEYYTEQEPYEDVEYYYEKEPYTIPYRECTKHSWWTGRCTEYDTFYKTEYRNVEKSKAVIKYRTIQKSRTITKYCNLWKRVAGLC